MNINRGKIFKEFFTKHDGSRSIEFLVLHHIQAQNIESVMQQFTQHQVSSHFVIDENGQIFQLVDENDIAYHAGHSFWRGVESLNAKSVGIEFINTSPFEKKFTEKQMQSGAELCKYLIVKYNIPAANVVGHSDIAFYAPNSLVEETQKIVDQQFVGFLDRKQDPSHLFDWQYLSKRAIGAYPEHVLKKSQEKILFKIGDKNYAISKAKETLSKIGYKVTNFNDEFDLEFQCLTRVFHRRFNQEKFLLGANPNFWYASSQFALDSLLEIVERR